MMRRALVLGALMLAAATHAGAQERQEFRITRATEAPKLDGILDDAAWLEAPLSAGDWMSYNPLRGDKMPPQFRTEVRIVHDDRNIYFAFHCFDEEPGKIRSTIARRDSVFSDDWIALSLDSAATGQTAYHLFINPSGIQMDALQTSASGEQFDADLVWYSVGRRTSDGYIVEVQVPLQTLRFKGGDEVRMGILFFRKISRMGVSYSWPAMPPGQWVFENHARLQFSNLHQPQLIELLPSTTYGVSQRRATATRWERASKKTDFGLSGKFGITSNVTLDGTVNPDFSQVESDAFQVEVNQRYPIFYSEKRPFFMEGMGLFNVAGNNGDGNMRSAVHTRRIINPFWGTKLTGTAGKTTFGVLNASDESPQDIGDRGPAVTDRNKLFTIARATYALRRADYVGAIFTDTEHAGRYNRVAGADLNVKFSPPQDFNFTVLRSDTSDGSRPATNGRASQVSYSYNTRRFTTFTQLEHYDRDFQMDTAFYNRTGFTSGWSFGEVNFYPKQGYWLQRVHPWFWTKAGHDEVQDGNERFLIGGLRLNFTRQGFLNVGTGRGREAWQGKEYQTGRRFQMYANMQTFRWLNVRGYANRGPDIYYDVVNPFQGNNRNFGFGLDLQPNQHFNQDVGFDAVNFTRASTGERVYSLKIVNLKTTYQFDKHLLVRLLEQYDSSTHRLLTDLLASYEFVPGTVFHAGYGSLYEKRADELRILGPNEAGGNYLTVNRGLFFKASYLHRF